MSSWEFTHWRAHFRLEPAGFHVENWRAGMIAATVANVGLRLSGSKRVKPDDFYPITRPRSRE